jgi:ribonuclease HII
VTSLELLRLQALMKYEKEVRTKGYSNIAGIDEAGRGPLAGPVVAAACILDSKAKFDGIDDSKCLSAIKRELLYKELSKSKKVIFSIGSISHEEIDRVNIYQATILAMFQAVAGLTITPDFLLVDGMNLPHPSIPHQKIIKGDSLSQSIAAASIIAKVTRDRLMLEYHEMWPLYGFDKHKGYGTAQHLDAIEKYGPCPIHRMTFAPLKLLLRI